MAEMSIKNYKIFIISVIIHKGYGLLIFSIGDFKRPFFFCGQKGKAMAVKKKTKTISKKTTNLTPKQELFCRLYASDREFFGNGVQSYIEAYGVDLTKKGAYLVARVEASKLLTKPNILKRIDEIFEGGGLNNSYVDKQLEKLITQDADFKSKLGAIKEYNTLHSRIQKKIDITSGNKPIPILGDLVKGVDKE